MMNLVFDKTEKGREEIATRQYHLQAKLRSLLLVIDGKQTAESLLRKFSAVGVTEDAFNDLIANEFIHSVAPPQAAAAPAAPAAVTPVAPVSVAADMDAAPAKETGQAMTPVLKDGETQYQAIYNFYGETIKSTLGLRGYGLQLKVEKCGSIEDFRALRLIYLEAVHKSKGSEMTRSLRDRLDQLLFLGETPPVTQVGKEF